MHASPMHTFCMHIQATTLPHTHRNVPHSAWVRRIIVGAFVTYLSEKALDTASHAMWVVDVHVVVLSTGWFLHKGLFHPHACVS